MDLGVWMLPGVLEHKLEAAEERNPEQAWNMGRWPKGLSEKGPHRLFVACDGVWRGYFVLSGDALYNPEDEKTPYTILFDARTWTEISPVSVRCFRGFTYDVPSHSGPQPASGPPAI